jgi:L-gulonate 5-dehydrogenase
LRAAVTRARSEMTVVDVPDPGPPGPGELIVRPEAVGLCGSDFHYFHGDIPDSVYPRIQGHEFSAIVEEGGELAPGTRVAVLPLSSCGECYPCRIGRVNACANISLIGIHRDGALQERLTVPAANAFPVNGTDARLAAFVEPMSIAVRTVVRGRVEAGEHVLVLGAGPIGQAVAIAALDRGAEVLLVDRLERRLELSTAECRLVGPDDDLAAVARAWAGEAPEVVVEATGAPEPMRAALEAVSPAGRLVVVGLSDYEVPLRIGRLPFRELDVLGVSCCNPGEFEVAADIVSRWHEAVAPLLTHDFSFEEAPDAIVYAIDHPDEVMKAVVHVA